jgi:hypothetical protein
VREGGERRAREVGAGLEWTGSLLTALARLSWVSYGSYFDSAGGLALHLVLIVTYRHQRACIIPLDSFLVCPFCTFTAVFPSNLDNHN